MDIFSLFNELQEIFKRFLLNIVQVDWFLIFVSIVAFLSVVLFVKKIIMD